MSAADLLNLAVDVGPLPMNAGACLILEAGPSVDVMRLRRVIADRACAIPRFRQLLVRAPFGCGRPLWVDDPAFDVYQHVRVSRCPSPGDERALLDLAVEAVGERLSASRPLWSIRLVTGLAGDRVGLIASFHHVVADGMGALALLAALADGSAAPPGPIPEPRPRPRRRTLAADAWIGRMRALTRWNPGALIAFRGLPGVARCSLNRTVGQHQQVSVVTAPLDAVHAYAHAHGGTVNDAVLAAVSGALRALLEGRGETSPMLVVSVLVSARRSASVDQLGNHADVLYIGIPTDGCLAERLERTAVVTRAAKAAARPEASAELIAGVGRIFLRLGLTRWMMNHQRLFHTVVSNMRGPERSLTIAGAPVQAIVPVTPVRGNVTTAFTVLSYAGTLTVAVTRDVDAVPDQPVLMAAVEEEFAAMRTDIGTAQPAGS
ncbi:DUF1298 domain-containing protein [Streptosporangiaceae bacterium NEAU-GS5]|nr:DUF1298 domain-containing protein [Streptosporangiaceae bacterium NEAU-GS5]